MTKITDYSIVVLADLAGRDGFAQAGELSERTRLPKPTVAKILKALTRGGVLESRRGADGGYALARPADRISIVDIIEAMEGPVAITECSLPVSVVCGETSHCALHGHWPRINRAVRAALADVSLAEVCRPPAPPRRERAPAALAEAP